MPLESLLPSSFENWLLSLFLLNSNLASIPLRCDLLRNYLFEVSINLFSMMFLTAGKLVSSLLRSFGRSLFCDSFFELFIPYLGTSNNYLLTEGLSSKL